MPCLDSKLPAKLDAINLRVGKVARSICALALCCKRCEAITKECAHRPITAFLGHSEGSAVTTFADVYLICRNSSFCYCENIRLI